MIANGSCSLLREEWSWVLSSVCLSIQSERDSVVAKESNNNKYFLVMERVFLMSVLEVASSLAFIKAQYVCLKVA